MNKQLVPLYVAHDIKTLDALVEKDDAIRNLKKVNRFTNIARKMMSELLQSQNDQEKCYIIGKRYINLLDHLFKISDDQNFTRSLYINDYHKVTQLISEFKSDLEKRYHALALQQLHSKSGDGADKAAIPSRSPSLKDQVESKTNLKISSGPRNTPITILADSKRQLPSAGETYDTFIGPKDLFTALMQKQNLLLVDIRTPSEFNDTRILIENHLGQGHIINIPGDFIIPGLSANTLGQKLGPDGQEIWEMRDSFQMIVLLDTYTQKHNFGGSKLERLRSFIVEWDFNRTYTQEPLVLSGGIKEFIEWYPTEVGNSHCFLSQTNSEIDELLNLESISYPEAGSGLQMNLKLHALSSTENNNDFGPEIRENLAEPYKSPSQESLFTNGPSEIEPILYVEPGVDYEIPSDSSSEDGSVAEIRDMVAGKRADLLRQARQAAKPKASGAADDKRQLQKGNRDDSKSTVTIRKLRSKIPSAPSIDRSFKPIIPDNRKTYGEGYCGLRNVKNICYMNSILQCMKVVPVIKGAFVTSDRYAYSTTLKPPRINPQMAQVMRELWGGTPDNPKHYFIEPFKRKLCETAPNFDRGNHEDAFEFFIFLFNLISDDCSFDLSPPPVMTESQKAWFGHLQGRSSFLIDAFYYQLKNTKTCYYCRRTYLSFDTDSTLMLAMDNAACSLQPMIEEYMKDNRVQDYSCSDCKSTSSILNRKEIVVDPEVLVIILKRYLINADGTSRKNDNEIDFPLKGLKFGKSVYDCCGVVQHSGNTSHGHYFATVLLDAKTNDWVLFNDDVVTRYSTVVNETFGVRASAAGFFYIRRS
ncbi:unnamed protein product [Phaedon cochleariae]|uniref:ubiquitinyl hydrolase 1 n=1 Tax=Phaedon cochleariae TaxID=80249 RepID=A0A9P0GR07_PHACE|nr:unnamed protein product [Phaedon cochleariae]